ncbi:uncharacterized protein LOC131310499 [Rhododendron vialii]|uniref:uncharacterized protein LOC131310499 n=1 Tax=Rhododendron vialii TaxID=182163 RepID=UPI00265E3573|nr:uncharacterized protein LOC131310499 [Rhododendron vialii]
MTNNPKLQKLTIEANSTSDSEEAAVKACEEKLASSKFCLKHLQEVEMHLVFGTTVELHFMKLLLATSPKLEIMVMKPHPIKVSDGGLMILKELMQFQRLSPKAKITYKDPNERNLQVSVMDEVHFGHLNKDPHMSSGICLFRSASLHLNQLAN